MTVETPFHLQRLLLPHERHAINLAVAGRAADALVHVNAVVEVDEVRQIVDARPLNRFAAAEALAQGTGVCQDYAHVMLAISRACGLPSRYVSGHLLGQGGTHAWVEVILPANDGTGEGIAYPFDPTQATKAGLSYVTIAVGGDYADVAPTSGTYLSQLAGRLMTRKSVTLVDLE